MTVIVWSCGRRCKCSRAVNQQPNHPNYFHWDFWLYSYLFTFYIVYYYCYFVCEWINRRVEPFVYFYLFYYVLDLMWICINIYFRIICALLHFVKLHSLFCNFSEEIQCAMMQQNNPTILGFWVPSSWYLFEFLDREHKRLLFMLPKAFSLCVSQSHDQRKDMHALRKSHKNVNF